MTTKEIDISELKPGMFVDRLGGSAVSLPQSFQNFRIRNEKDVTRLKRANVTKVVIDLDKSEKAEEAVAIEKLTKGVSKDLKKEIKAAKNLQNNAKETINKAMESVLQDQPVEAKVLTPVVNQTYESLVRNDQALLTLMHMKRHGSVLLSHAFSVLSLVTAVANRLEYEYEKIEMLGMAAMMYDVGWVRLPANLVSKDKSFTDKEEQLVSKHPAFGVEILKKSKELPEEVIQIISEHHEYLDGSGYPNRLTGDYISDMGRLLTVVDMYDMLVHGIMGNQGRTPNTALKNLYKASKEGKIDGAIIPPLVHVLGVYPITSAVVFESGEKGVVIEMNRKSPILPTVKVCYDSVGNPLSDPRIVNLAEESESGSGRMVIEKIIDPAISGVDPLNLLKIDDR
ncbi:MAG: DUF3391 domain-containing protein [Gammaproteobacteria bacterium]|nr:MAG: DUF3391 domain-containing protein [Gammaproteobacteria bacterium]